MTGPTLFKLGDTNINLAGTSSSIDGMTSIGTSIITAKNNESLSLNSGTSIFFDTNDNNSMMITPGGSVGIGTNEPSTLLDINGEFSANNPGWYFYNNTGSAGDVSYTNGDVFFANPGISGGTGTQYFNNAKLSNSALLSAWDSSSGVFTIPTSGMYIINIFVYHQTGTTASRSFVFQYLDSSSTIIDQQFLYFNNAAAISGNNERNMSYTRYFAAGEKFKVIHGSVGTTVLFFNDGIGVAEIGHTNMQVNKIN